MRLLRRLLHGYQVLDSVFIAVLWVFGLWQWLMLCETSNALLKCVEIGICIGSINAAAVPFESKI